MNDANLYETLFTLPEPLIFSDRDIPELLDALHARLVDNDDEQDKAFVRALIGLIELRQLGATYGKTLVPLFRLEDCAIEVTAGDDRVSVIELSLLRDPARRVRYTCTDDGRGHCEVEAACEPEDWAYMKPYNDLFIANLSRHLPGWRQVS